jgi:hypothetical protein
LSPKKKGWKSSSPTTLKSEPEMTGQEKHGEDYKKGIRQIVKPGMKNIITIFNKIPGNGGGVGLTPGMPIGQGGINLIKPHQEGKDNQNG